MPRFLTVGSESINLDHVRAVNFWHAKEALALDREGLPIPDEMTCTVQLEWHTGAGAARIYRGPEALALAKFFSEPGVRTYDDHTFAIVHVLTGESSIINVARFNSTLEPSRVTMQQVWIAEQELEMATRFVREMRETAQANQRRN